MNGKDDINMNSFFELIDNDLKSIDSPLDWDLKKSAWIDKSTIFFSEKGIEEERFGDTTHNKLNLEGLNELLGEVFPIDIDFPQYEQLGSIGLKEWIYVNVVDQEFKQEFVKRFLKSKKEVSPSTLLKIIKGIKAYIEDCSHFYKQAPEDLTKEQLCSDEIITLQLYSKIKNKGVQFYIRQFISSLDPFGKTILLIANQRRLSFNHPIIEKYKNDIRKKGTKENSIETLESNLKKFFTWSSNTLACFNGYDISDLPIWKFSKEHLKSYKAYLEKLLKSGEMTGVSAKQHFIYVLSFFRYLYSSEDLIEDITKGLQNISANAYTYRYIPSTEELQNFFESVNRFSNKPQHEKLAYMFMLTLGLRIEEVVQLKWNNINLNTNTVSFLGKGKKAAIFPIPTALRHSLSELIEDKSCDYIFDKNPLQFRNDLLSNFKLYKLVSGWDLEQGVHIFRHIFVTTMSRHCDPSSLQKVARHKSLNTVSLYLHHADSSLIEAVNQISRNGEI